MSDGVLKKYRNQLPITNSTPMLDLGEGSTPLVKSRYIGPKSGCAELYFKLEGCNPTGSFKDRGMVVAVSKAVEDGARGIICASTGNTSASAAAYASHAGLSSIVVVQKNRISKDKLLQTIAHGGRVFSLDSSFDDSLKILRQIKNRNGFVLVNSINPDRIQGQKTAAFEIVEDTNGLMDYVFIPVGNAGNITAYWSGFVEAYDIGWTNRRPKMMGFQASGSAPIVEDMVVANPQTVASAIRIGNPASWDGALKARDESGGDIASVDDGEIVETVRLMAHREGVFCEPAAAVGVAGFIKMADNGVDFDRKVVICIVTGTGLKDTSLVSDFATAEIEEYAADLEVLERAIRSDSLS